MINFNCILISNAYELNRQILINPILFDFIVESLTCIGNWTSNDGQRRYLIGSLDVPFVTRLEDKIRCFLYKDTNNGGWKISQSSSPSCDHLRSFKAGYRYMHLKKGIKIFLIQLLMIVQNTYRHIS